MVKLLLASGRADPDSKDKHGQTPLSYVSKRKHEVVVKLLLASGHVDPDSKDN